MKAAVILHTDHLDKIMFSGSYEDCINYMRKRKCWSDLRYLNEDGSLGRLASYVL